MTPWLLPLLTGLVGLAFGTHVLHRWRTQRRVHQLLWAAGLLAYGLASLAEARVALAGWTPLLYRLYFPLAAGLVGLLGAGTVALQARPRRARGFALLVAALVTAAAVGPWTVDLAPGSEVPHDDGTVRLDDAGTDLGADAVPLPHPSRVAFLLLNVLGGLALVGGAFLTWHRTGDRAILLVAVGALVPFLGGSLSTLGLPDPRITAQFAGVVVMYAGYLAGTGMAWPLRRPGATGP